jgi:ABC-type transport system involved in multi-copper enzyme maturation permease subunit
MKTVIRLTWATGGFELKFLLAGSLLLATASLAIAFLLNANAPGPSCMANSTTPNCDTAFFYQLGSLGSQLIIAMGVLPIVVGGVLGSQLFSREIERATVQLPWSLTSSRTSWLAERVVILLVLVGLIVLAPAIATTILEGSINPDVPATDTLVDFGFRGVSVVARAAAIFSIAALVGLTVGRALPSLLLSVVAALSIVIAVPFVALATQPTEFIAPLGDPKVRYGLVREERYQDPAGTLFTIDEVTARVPPDAGDPTTWIEANYRQVATGVRGVRYWDAELASTFLLAAVTIASLGAATVVVARRRPY